MQPHPRFYKAFCRRVLALVVALAAVIGLSPTARAAIVDASWTEPTTNVDGSSLTDLAGYRVYYDLEDSECAGDAFDEIAAVSASPPANSTVSHRLTGLDLGTRYFVSVAAVDASGNESACVSAAQSVVAHNDFAVSPGAVNTSFGSVPVNGTAERTFTVSNPRGGTVSGTATVPRPFRIVSGSPFTLVGAGATRTVTVRFTPTVAIASPTTASTFRTRRSSQTLSGTASDDTGVTRVTWTNSAGGGGTAGGTSEWTATDIPLAVGTNVITITAHDAAGHAATDRITVTRDSTPPAVSITTPSSSARVSGAVTVSASATDGTGVVGVQFKLDGVNLGSEVRSAPYSVVWQTSTAAAGAHVLTAVARDAVGNRTTSAAVTVHVQ